MQRESLSAMFGCNYPEHYARNVVLDAFVVMPNHFHGIVDGFSVGAYCNTPLQRTRCNNRCTVHHHQTIGAVVRGFKGCLNETGQYSTHGTPGAILWQRNYYEHILRSEQSLYQIRQYVSENPVRWAEDKENPACR